MDDTPSLSPLSTPSIVYITDVGYEAAFPVFFTNTVIVTTLLGVGYLGSMEISSNIGYVEFPPSPGCSSAADTTPGINPGIISIINNIEIIEFRKSAFIFISFRPHVRKQKRLVYQ